MKLLILLIVVAFTAYVVNAKPNPISVENEGVEAMIRNAINHRVRRQSPTKKKDFDTMISRLESDTAAQGVGFCEGNWEKGIQCFEEDICVPWFGVCDGTQICGIEKKEACINSTKESEKEIDISQKENCFGDEGENWCPMKQYVPVRCGMDYSIGIGETQVINYIFYDNGMDCIWSVKAAEGQEIVVKFRKFETEKSYDFLSLGTGLKELDDSPSQYIIFKHSGGELPDPAHFKVTTNEVWLRFTSDDWDRKGGFSVEISDASENDPGVTMESPFDKEKNTTCGGEIKLEADEEVVITSPDFPQFYPNYFECVWTVTVPKGRHVGVGFEYFSLEKDADFLEIGDGGTVGSDIVDKLTGNKIPTRAIESTSNQAWLKFTSDVANNRLGFKAKVRDQPFNGCGGEFEVPRDGSIVMASPLYPDLGYKINLDCTWKITGDPERGLTVVFKEFYTEQRYDTVSAGFGPEPKRDGSNYVINAHSGQDLPDPPEFTTDGNTAWVHMKTDSQKIDRGFKLEIFDSAVRESNTTVATQKPLEIDYDCGGKVKVDVTTGKAIVRSPGFPRRYRPVLDCTWEVDFEYDANFTIDFDLFTTETGRDVLSMGTGRDPEDESTIILKEHSGSKKPDHMQLNGTRYMWLRFLSDFANEKQGFSVALATVPTSRCGGFFNVPSNGSIVLSSPGYPNYYPPGLICRYTINGPDDNRLRVSIPEFYTSRYDDELSVGEGCRERDPDSILVVDKHSGIGPPNPSVYLPRSSAIWMAFKVNSLGNRYKGWLATFTDAKIKADARLDDMGAPIRCEELAPTEPPPPTTPTPYPTPEGSGWFPYWYDLIEASGEGGATKTPTDYPDFL